MSGHHPILVIGFGVRGKRDIEERRRERAEYSSGEKEKLRHALMAEGSLNAAAMSSFGKAVVQCCAENWTMTIGVIIIRIQNITRTIQYPGPGVAR